MIKRCSECGEVVKEQDISIPIESNDMFYISGISICLDNKPRHIKRVFKFGTFNRQLCGIVVDSTDQADFIDWLIR